MSFKELPIMSDKKGINLFYPYIPSRAHLALKKTLKTRWIGKGPMVDKFENKFKKMFAGARRFEILRQQLSFR